MGIQYSTAHSLQDSYLTLLTECIPHIQQDPKEKLENLSISVEFDSKAEVFVEKQGGKIKVK
jgi:hypothetical protein